MQGDLETALATVLRLPAVALTVAGRTDAGVHATGQVAHCDLPGLPARLARRLAGVLPPDVRVHSMRRGAARLRRPVHRAVAALRVPDRRRADRRGPAAPPRGAGLAAPAGRDGDGRRPRPACVGLHDFAAFCRHREGGTTSARCSGCDVRARAATRSSSTVRPTRSATRWCARWSARCWRSARAAATRTGRRRCSSRIDAPSDVPVAAAHGLTLVAGRLPARRRTRRARRADPRPRARPVSCVR